MIDKLEHEGTEVKQPKLIMDCQKNDLQCFQTVSYKFLDFHFNPMRTVLTQTSLSARSQR